MPDIFINYRTGDEEASARLIDQELSRRFGSNRIFRASKSIAPGEDYIRELLTAVRDSKALLAVIGSRWLTAVDEQGRSRLSNEADWTRREILEAFEHDVRVIPVLVGRTLSTLRQSDLPPKLARLANCQYRRLDHRSSGIELRDLGDYLATFIPSLVDHDRPDEGPAPNVDNRWGMPTLRDHIHQQTGGTNTIVNNANAPVNSGTGHQFTGDGVNYVTGGNSGEIRQIFGIRRDLSDGGK